MAYRSVRLWWVVGIAALVSLLLGTVPPAVRAGAVQTPMSLTAWGRNDWQQCSTFQGLNGVVEIAAGFGHTVALKEDGTVVACGNNEYTQCNVPTGLSNVNAIAAGNWHTVALRNDGTVVAWGNNTYSQCTVPAGLGGIVGIAAGYGHTVGLKNDGTVVAWGYNGSGQCNVPPEAINVVAIAAGAFYTVALKSDGTVVAWGSNGNGQCNVPPELSGVTAIATGASHTVALKSDGTVVAWGDNSYGQCNVPAGLSGVTAIAAGASHTVALRSDGTVVAWGWNDYGQCNVPADLSHVGAIAAGGCHTVALIPINTSPVAMDWAMSSNEDYNIAGTCTAVDADNDPLTFSVVGGPEHGMLDFHPDGSYLYIPNADWNGTDSFAFTATDGFSVSNTAHVTFILSAVNDPPVAKDGAVMADEDTVVSGTCAASDVDRDPLTFSVLYPPQYGTLTLSSDGAFAYLPKADWNGTDRFTFRANDGHVDSNIATVTITINPVNDTPVAENLEITTDENAVASGKCTATDVDNDPLTFSVVNPTQHGMLAFNADGSFTYTPDKNYSGTDSFTYKANDGQADSNIATVNIIINAVNGAPVAEDLAVTTDEDTPVSGTCKATDGENDPLAFSAVAKPQHGMLLLKADGSFTYTPDKNYYGTDSFTYKANDGHADSNIATANIIIKAVNDAPIAKPDTVSTVSGTPVKINVLGNDSDVDKDSLKVTGVTQPRSGSVVLNADNTVIYTPRNNFVGTDTFTYTINDGNGGTATATVTVNVGQANQPPRAVVDNATTARNTSVVIDVLANDTDVDGDLLTLTGTTAPLHGTVTWTADGNVTYTPTAGFRGGDTFTYTVYDGQGGTTMGRVIVRVR